MGDNSNIAGVTSRSNRTIVKGLWSDLFSGLLNGRPYMRTETTPIEVARGNIEGAYPFGAYGEREAAGAENNRVVWPNGAFELPASSGVQMSIVSTSANDSSGGSGVRQVEIHYLDSSLNEQIELVSLNGLTPVTTSATNIRFINCMHIETIGTTPYAIGDITASNGGTVYSQISAGDVRCTSSAKMVPAGKNLYIAGVSGGAVSSTADAKVVIRMVASELDSKQYLDPLIFMPFGSAAQQNGTATFNFKVPPRFSPGTVVAATSTVDKAATIAASWFGWLEGV